MEFNSDEAQRVIRDKSHPHYAKYHDGDKAINESVTRALKRQIPGDLDLSDTTPLALRGAAPGKVEYDSQLVKWLLSIK